MKSLPALVALATLSMSAAFAAPPAGHPTPAAAASMMGMAPVAEAELTQKGKVVSTTDANEYTYIEVTQGQQTTWLAAQKLSLKKGDTIRYDNGAVMTNFYSKLLKRTFPSVTFVNRVVVSNGK
ncbi:hypothetical protein [Noviherbaspirillum sp. UKPF54]|uniref:hypothetical protein n=1 Tax=Noviherbaspirillum sp. UKPF54 TaxID=2601898 RepID=UPI0011B114BF|nr:hypothetical protein [Noviherbaspirillum sp. UKPF54]QDZ29903.1 hypothetical protein FAY22_19205 [Noviherbaspirillum sp. UKPF54]